MIVLRTPICDCKSSGVRLRRGRGDSCRFVSEVANLERNQQQQAEKGYRWWQLLAARMNGPLTGLCRKEEEEER